MKSVLVVCAAGVLGGLICVIDVLLPGSPHLPAAVPITIAAIGLVLSVGLTVHSLEQGFQPTRRHRRYLRRLVPFRMRVFTGVLFAACVILITVSGDRSDALELPIFAFLVTYLTSLQAVALERFRRLPDPADDPHRWTPPDKPDYGSSWRAR